MSRDHARDTSGNAVATRWENGSSGDRAVWVLALILLVGSLLRFYQLGTLSFWYDEVVTMRLARAPSVHSLLKRLAQIDATRAPLHPLMLQQWIRIFGHSESAARSLSVISGILTIVLIFQTGRLVFDTATGLWAAWLAGLSPLLIVYSREARMYASLVLLTCLCWYLLLTMRRSHAIGRAIGYGVSLAALGYTHPLGILMAGTLALGGLIGLSGYFGCLRRWLLVHFGVFLLVLPWVGKYLDHRPEFLSGRLPIRFLVGTPIGFLGGDSRIMIGVLGLIVCGLAQFVSGRDSKGRWRIDRGRCGSPGLLILWLILPPTALYVHSRIADPIFGPARYTVFVAPAYLILVAAGLRYSPALLRYPAAFLLAIIASLAIGPKVYAPDLKADWRDFSRSIAQRMGDRVLVIVSSADPARNVEVEAARYYLPPDCSVIASDEATADRLAGIEAGSIYFAVGSRDQEPATPVPERVGPYRMGEPVRYPGLIVYRPGL